MDFGKLDLNDDIKKKLSAEIDGGRLSHAILLTGKNNGTRKKLTRRIAAAMLCTSDKARPCGKCPACVKTKSNLHPDIIETEGTEKQKSIKIDAIRDMRRKAYIIPNEADLKIFIILEASGMGEEAQNALLKLIEEPPDFTRFILACASKDQLLPTILSRLSHYYIGEGDAGGTSSKTREKINYTASQIVESLTSDSEFDLIISTAPLERDRALFKKCADELILIFRDALRLAGSAPQQYRSSIQYLSENINLPNKIAERYTQKEILLLIERLKILSDDAGKNANENLLLARLAASLKIPVNTD